MLGDQNIVAFVPTSDFSRAKAFYQGKLGLEFKYQDGFALVLDANGIRLRIAKVPDVEVRASPSRGMSGLRRAVEPLS